MGGRGYLGLSLLPVGSGNQASLGAMPPPSALAGIPLITDPQPSLQPGASAIGGVVAGRSTPAPELADLLTGTADLPAESSAPGGAVEGAHTSRNGPATCAGLSLSPASEPFPWRLWNRVRTDEFVEMWDLLMDNITLLQRLKVFGGHRPLAAVPGMMRPHLREVTTLPTWMHCFLAYVTLRTRDPCTRDMLAYARLLIREAQRHPGNGWLDYDRVFRQQVAIDPTMAWNTLHPGIQSATLVGQAAGQAVNFCTLCREVDHTAAQCALAYLQPPPDQGLPPQLAPHPRAPARQRPETLGPCIPPMHLRYSNSPQPP